MNLYFLSYLWIKSHHGVCLCVWSGPWWTPHCSSFPITASVSTCRPWTGCESGCARVVIDVHTNLVSVYVYDFSPCSFFFSILGILKETKSKLSTPLFWRPAASLRFCKFRFVFPPLTLWHKTRHLFGLHTSSHNYFGSPLFRLLMDNRIQRIPENTFHSLWKLAELWVTLVEGSDFWYW